MFHVPEKFRIKTGNYASDETFGNNGAFIVRPQKDKYRWPLLCIASDGEDWEHVSVSLYQNNPKRCPKWEEMCIIKNLFWDEDDCVIQYHPAKKDYVNCHPYTLHLWRPVIDVIPTPLPYMV